MAFDLQDGVSSKIAVGLLVLSVLCGCGKRSFDEDYEPSQDFQAAFNAMESDRVDGASVCTRNGNVGDTLDLERTVQLMRGIELAQEKSDDWMSFLELLANPTFQENRENSSLAGVFSIFGQLAFRFSTTS